MEVLSPHPSDEILIAFGSGRLDDAASDTVVAHLETCQACLKKATSLSGDSFLKRMRVAQQGSGTPSPEKWWEGLNSSQPEQPSANTQAPEPVPPELRELQQYEVIRELGHGGMGVVYLAKNKLMSRPEVLKVLNKQLLEDTDASARFLREICSAASLNHPNIVTAYSALQLGGLVVFAMEYVDGEDLAKVVGQRGPLPVANACYYTQQAAQGLQHAFEKGMVHRDIKPQNLILAREGRKHVVKILDFGLAKATREKERQELGLNRRQFARLTAASERAVADWEDDQPISPVNQKSLRESERLCQALMKIMKPDYVGKWLDTPNDAFSGLKPLDLVERGEIDRLWRMIFEVESGALT